MPARYNLASRASRLPENPESGMFREGKRGRDDLQYAPLLFLDNPRKALIVLVVEKDHPTIRKRGR
jgi:hypothetical protein